MASVSLITIPTSFGRYAPATLAACLMTLLCVGCAGRYVTRTEYLAPDFTRTSIRGRTVAIVPATDDAATASRGELAGVARGLRDAGARVRVIDPTPAAQPAAARLGPSDFTPAPADRVALLADFTGGPDSDAARREAQRMGQNVNAQYLLFVRVTDGEIFHRFTPPHDPGAGPPTRASGRRVGLRLALVRLRDSAAVWVASGTGESWATRSDASGAAATNVEADLAAGNLPLYPPPPPAPDLASRLTRRLLARVPLPVEIEPN